MINSSIAAKAITASTAAAPIKVKVRFDALKWWKCTFFYEDIFVLATGLPFVPAR